MTQHPISKPHALPAFDLMCFTPYRLTIAAQKLSAELARQYKDKFDISISEWRVLVHIAHAGTPSVRDIEAKVGIEKSKVSRAAARLEKRGLITKQVNPEDRRLLHLSLTQQGEGLMSELLPLAQQFQSDIEARLGAKLDGLEAAISEILHDQ